jgi:two-component system LytT family response regulator
VPVHRWRVAVVDDEPVVREGMTDFLAAQPDLELVGEARDGPAAVRLIESRHPDLVFLDIQMPGLDGFGVLDALAPEALPAVVFITAYDQYALRAFEVHAVDYLLKPFDRGRLATALERARVRLANGDWHKGITALLAAMRAQHLTRLPVRSRNRTYFVDVADVDWFEGAGNYVRLHVGDRVHLVRATLKHLAARLDPERFQRIHRSTILNVERLREIQSLSSGDCRLVLDGGAQVTLSRTYRQRFERLVLGVPIGQRPNGKAPPG